MNETPQTPSIRIIDSDEELIKLKDFWNGLLENSNADTVFLTWEWVWEWWQHFKESKKLVVLAAEEDGRLIGIAPFYAQKVRFFGLRRYTHLELCGSVGVSSQYLDFIIMKGRERELIRRFLDELLSNSKIRWDVLNFICVKKESENLRCCREYWAEKGKKVNIYEEWPNFIINFSENISNLSKVLGTEQGTSSRKKKNKLCKQYQTHLEVITSPENHEKDLADFIRLHQLRQQEKNEKGSFNAQRRQFTAFHTAVSKDLLQKGWCHFVFLNVDGGRIAGQYSFIYKGKMHCYSVGFDPAWSKASVGNVLYYMLIEHAIQNNYQEFDFFYGDEKYKSHWTKDTRMIVNASCWRSDFVYFLACLEKKVRLFSKLLIPKKLGVNLYSYLFMRKEY